MFNQNGKKQSLDVMGKGRIAILNYLNRLDLKNIRESYGIAKTLVEANVGEINE